MHLGTMVLAAAALALAADAPAVAQTVVESVQMPAWLDRGGELRPLAIGSEVKNGDTLRIGAAGRAYLKLGDGSTVKLGSGASLRYYSLSLRPQRHFRAALDVVAGAFRFTTAAVQRVGGDRDLNIRVGTITAGIRGTDVWGKSDAERDLVCLIEGHVELRHRGETTDLDQALAYAAAPKGAAALGVDRVDPDQLQRWARETEVLPGDGAVRRGGRWKLLLASLELETQALALYDRAREAGFAVKIRPRSGGAAGKWIYDVQIEQLASEQEALVLADRLYADTALQATARR